MVKKKVLLALCLVIGCFALQTGCARTSSQFKSYTANELYRGYKAKDKVILSQDGKIIHVEGRITRIDKSALNDIFIELNSRIIVLLNSDEIKKIGKIGLKNGDNITVVGNFAGEGVLSAWLTNAKNTVLVMENAQILNKEQWYDLKNFENPLFY